jgi:hypothetical protein
MNKTELARLDENCGTTAYYDFPPFPRFVLTDGTLALARHGDCFWLLQEIANAQSLPVIKNDSRLQEMQFWKLKKNLQPEQFAPFTVGHLLNYNRPPTAMATLVCERDSDDVAWTKDILYTDFPFDVLPECKIWVAPTSLDGKTLVRVAYLPSEH